MDFNVVVNFLRSLNYWSFVPPPRSEQGTYAICVGEYDPETGQRIELYLSPEGEVVKGTLTLPTLELTPDQLVSLPKDFTRQLQQFKEDILADGLREKKFNQACPILKSYMNKFDELEVVTLVGLDNQYQEWNLCIPVNYQQFLIRPKEERIPDDGEFDGDWFEFGFDPLTQLLTCHMFSGDTKYTPDEIFLEWAKLHNVDVSGTSSNPKNWKNVSEIEDLFQAVKELGVAWAVRGEMQK